ncbi:MAG: hypothetical protein EBZ30_05885, partial [Flavobacteriia bacterium]|nr:hypothetical protein [Flavobacteriia bacterium]
MWNRSGCKAATSHPRIPAHPMRRRHAMRIELHTKASKCRGMPRQELFPGTQIEEAFVFHVTRDTDLVIQEDEADDLLETVDQGLKQIRYGNVSRLHVEAKMPPK